MKGGKKNRRNRQIRKWIFLLIQDLRGGGEIEEFLQLHSDENLFSTVRKTKCSEEYSREELEETATGRNLVFEADMMPDYFFLGGRFPK